MRVAALRTDIGHLYLDDIENSSQRNFSSEPAGQSRYIHSPTDAELAAVLKSYAFVTRVGSTASPFDTTIADGTILKIKASAAAAYTSITVTSGAAVTAAQIVVDLNLGFTNAGLPFRARVSGANVAIDSTIGGPAAYIQMDTTAAALATVLGLTIAALSGLTVSLLIKAVYVGLNAVAGQTGVAATVTAFDGTEATIGGLTGMQASDVGKVITFSGSANPANNGTFRINDFISATSVKVANEDAVSPDAALTWTEYANMSVDVSVATINALSSFSLLTTAQKSALDTAIANVIAPSLVETGPVLLSFVYGKLSKLSSSSYQPGGARIGLPAGAAVACVANDGSTPYTI